MERPDAVPDRRSAHAKTFAEFTLHRQSIADSQEPAGDGGLDLQHDVVRDVAWLDLLECESLGRCHRASWDLVRRLDGTMIGPATVLTLRQRATPDKPRSQDVSPTPRPRARAAMMGQSGGSHDDVRLAVEPPLGKLRATFSSLSNVNYRRYFFGHALSITGTWMQRVGQAWLVLELTGSGTLLGITAALQHLPVLLLGAYGGLLADRVDKRRLLLLTQSLGASLALALAVLTATGAIRVGMVFVLAGAMGAVHAIDRPTRQAIIMEMVGPDLISNAVTLNNITWNAAQAIGPALAGAVIATHGLAMSFFLNAASYFAVVLVLMMLRTHDLVPSERVPRSRGQLREGLNYVRRTPELVAPMIVLVIVGMFAFEWAVTLPLLAEEAFGGDAQTFGWMFSSMGSGAVIGGLLVAGSVSSSMRFLAGSSAVFGLLMTLTAAAPTLPLVLVGLFLVGAAGVALRSTAMSVLQLRSLPSMRGRVVALFAVATTGTTPIGGPLAGAVAEFLGARVALGLGGLSAILAALAVVLYQRRAGAVQVSAGPAALAHPTSDGESPLRGRR
ncbi:MFS transporter [Egicoccus sp. AB-alg6-2]|uniref:MFS transporter n=1 Tax=Egicoccus sp. AB-alg6-2 TaxID=3242692 RepID=UPI00359D945A